MGSEKFCDWVSDFQGVCLIERQDDHLDGKEEKRPLH